MVSPRLSMGLLILPIIFPAGVILMISVALIGATIVDRLRDDQCSTGGCVSVTDPSNDAVLISLQPRPVEFAVSYLSEQYGLVSTFDTQSSCTSIQLCGPQLQQELRFDYPALPEGNPVLMLNTIEDIGIAKITAGIYPSDIITLVPTIEPETVQPTHFRPVVAGSLTAMGSRPIGQRSTMQIFRAQTMTYDEQTQQVWVLQQSLAGNPERYLRFTIHSPLNPLDQVGSTQTDSDQTALDPSWLEQVIAESRLFQTTRLLGKEQQLVVDLNTWEQVTIGAAQINLPPELRVRRTVSESGDYVSAQFRTAAELTSVHIEISIVPSESVSELALDETRELPLSLGVVSERIAYRISPDQSQAVRIHATAPAVYLPSLEHFIRSVSWTEVD